MEIASGSAGIRIKIVADAGYELPDVTGAFKLDQN